MLSLLVVAGLLAPFILAAYSFLWWHERRIKRSEEEIRSLQRVRNMLGGLLRPESESQGRVDQQAVLDSRYLGILEKRVAYIEGVLASALQRPAAAVSPEGNCSDSVSTDPTRMPAIERLPTGPWPGPSSAPPVSTLATPTPSTPAPLDHKAIALGALRHLAEKDVAAEQVGEFARRCDPSMITLPIVGAEKDWLLLRLQRGREAYLIPALRRSMGGCQLKDYFEIRNYNGIDPLRANWVMQLPKQQQGTDGQWRIVQKGEIDGSAD